ncbi:hypothetical protein FSP39_010177, partial [Pinctada imbricata]
YIDLEPFGITGKGRTALIFSSDACKTMWIGLMPDKHDTSSMYDISLGRGGNKFLAIEKDGKEKKRVKSSILDCTPKELWITWKDGRIAVGEGTDIAKNVVMEWTDDDPLDVNDIGLSSWDKEWTFQNFGL